MTTEQDETGHIEQVSTGTALKRRGLIAGAAALVAGIVAKQTAQPVAAAPTYLTLSNNDYTTNVGTAPTVLTSLTGNFPSNQPVFQVSPSIALSVDGIHASGSQHYGNGIVGTGGSAPFGTSPGGSGVIGTGGYAETETGFGGPGGSGVVGNGGSGVIGGDGVVAMGANGGDRNGGGHGGNGVSAFAGIGPTNGKWYRRLRSERRYWHVRSFLRLLWHHRHHHRQSSLLRYHGRGECGWGSRRRRGTSNAKAYAGYFSGNVVVDGNFTVIDPTKKHGAIKSSATGQYHTLYSVESPEPWLEDFGTGTLVNGKVEIMLDPTFADVIHTEDYHVFLTSHDPQSRGLAVGTRHANGFAVQEHAGGTSGGTFRYRVVARPKSDNKAARLATFTVPNITIPTIADLPKPPKPPEPPKMPKKP